MLGFDTWWKGITGASWTWKLTRWDIFLFNNFVYNHSLLSILFSIWIQLINAAGAYFCFCCCSAGSKQWDLEFCFVETTACCGVRYGCINKNSLFVHIYSFKWWLLKTRLCYSATIIKLWGGIDHYFSMVLAHSVWEGDANSTPSWSQCIKPGATSA